MRKFSSVLLVSLLIFSLTACSGEKSVSQGSGEESMEIPAIPAQESTGKDEVDFSQAEDALDAGQTPEPEDGEKNQAGNNILIVYFSRWGNTDYPDDVDATTSASIVIDGDGRYGVCRLSGMGNRCSASSPVILK